MADGRLDLEVNISGTDAAAAGLGKVETGLDKVAAAEKRTRDSAYGARQAHENWVAGYKGEVFSEMAEKIKRVSHVSRETNPDLRWMGEGFKSAGKDALASKSALGSLSSGTIAARAAFHSFSQFMRGDFVGAARSAALSVKTLQASLSAGVWGIYAAGAILAISGIIAILEKAKQKKRELEASKWAAEQAGWEIEDTRNKRENPYADSLMGKTDATLDAELSKMEIAYKNAKAKTDHEKGILGTAPDKRSRDESEKILQQNKQVEDERFSQLQDIRAEIDRRKNTKSQSAQDDSARRQTRISEEAKEGDRQWAVHNETTRGRRELDRETELSSIRDPILRGEKKLEYLEWDKKVQKSIGGVDAEAKILEIDREILSIQAAITQEKEAQAEKEKSEKAAEAEARKSLESRKAEYEFSKLTTAEQLKVVDMKMAKLRQGPKTLGAEGQMLDLQQRRDSLVEQIAREKEDAEDDGDSEETAAASGRKVKRMSNSRSNWKTRNARDWMKQQMAARRAASGMGDPATKTTSDAPVEVKGVDRTNQLLVTIVGKLS